MKNQNEQRKVTIYPRIMMELKVTPSELRAIKENGELDLALIIGRGDASICKHCDHYLPETDFMRDDHVQIQETDLKLKSSVTL